MITYKPEEIGGLIMHRSRIDIIIDILDVARAGANKTKIVYKTNLNFKLADKYLDLLQKRGLIENKLDKYITTEKGKILLERAREIASELTFEEDTPEKIRSGRLKIESSDRSSIRISGSFYSY